MNGQTTADLDRLGDGYNRIIRGEYHSFAVF